MMRAMPYNLQGKGVVEVSGIISQISSAVPPKWKSLDKFHHHQQHQQQDKATPATAISEEEEEEEARRTSSIDSEEPTSTLDTTRRSPSTPTSTSTSTLSSSLNNNNSSNTNNNNSNNNKENTASETAAAAAAGVANPGACVRKEGGWGSELHNLHQRSGDCDNVTATGNNNNTATATAAAAACIGVDRLVENSAALEDWDTMFPTGEGALLPWIIGDAEDPSLGLKHLLQSASHVVDYEGNAGLGVVDQAPDFDVHHHPPLGVSGNHNNSNDDGGSNSGFLGSEFGNNGKIGCLMDAAAAATKVSSNSNSNSNNGMNLGSNSMLLGSVAASFGQQYEFGDEKPQIYNPQLVMNPQQVAQTLGNPSFLMPPLGYCQLDPHLGGFQPPTKRHNPGVVLDPNLVVKNSFVDQGHELLLRRHHQHHHQQQHHQQVGGFQQLPMGLPPQLVPPNLQQQKPMLSTKQNHQQQQQQQQHFPLPVLHNQQQQQQQEQFIRDTLYKAADLIQTGNFSLAQEILARLNHPLSLSSKPLDRAALYVKEALQMLLLMGNPVAAPPPSSSSSSKNLTPFDVVHKMNAYKVFSEVSPFTQFINFTSTQAILEALDDSDALHIIDFDIGCGAQWASFIQELPLRKRGPPSLKITAFAPLSTTHPFEIGLVRDNLVQFASDTGVPFELQVVNLDSFDPSSCSMPNFRASEDEAVAVSIPVWSSSNRPSILPPILEFIKQRAPKIVVSLDRGFDRYDVPFPQHLVHTLDSCTSFLESLDGHVASDIGTKVEKFFVQPRIENTVLGRVHFPEKMPHWKNLFSSAGFSPVQFSNFTETQADYVVKRTPGRGFHVEKRQASLVLSWQRRELVAASAWRC